MNTSSHEVHLGLLEIGFCTTGKACVYPYETNKKPFTMIKYRRMKRRLDKKRGKAGDLLEKKDELHILKDEIDNIKQEGIDLWTQEWKKETTSALRLFYLGWERYHEMRDKFEETTRLIKDWESNNKKHFLGTSQLDSQEWIDFRHIFLDEYNKEYINEEGFKNDIMPILFSPSWKVYPSDILNIARKNISELLTFRRDFMGITDGRIPGFNLLSKAEQRKLNQVNKAYIEHASSILKCNTWESGKECAILSGYGNKLSSSHLGRTKVDP